MRIKTVPFSIMILFNFLYLQGQSISTDMDTATGLQNMYVTKDTAQTIAVAFRVIGSGSMYSYQFKVAFDTARLTFIAASEDFGINGEKNILKKNGGMIIGFSQFQVTPPASDTFEFSYSIIGTDGTKSVSGDGLLGVLYFKTRFTYGDSSKISVLQGFGASFGGDLIPVTSYSGGTCKILPVVSIDNRNCLHVPSTTDRFETIEIAVKNRYVSIAVPEAFLRTTKRFTIHLFTLAGKLLATCNLPSGTRRIQSDIFQKSGAFFNLSSGTCLLSIEGEGSRFTRAITIP